MLDEFLRQSVIAEITEVGMGKIPLGAVDLHDQLIELIGENARDMKIHLVDIAAEQRDFFIAGITEQRTLRHNQELFRKWPNRDHGLEVARELVTTVRF